MNNSEYLSQVISELNRLLAELQEDNISLVEQINAFVNMSLDDFALWQHKLKYNKEEEPCFAFDVGDFIEGRGGDIYLCKEKRDDRMVIHGVSKHVIGYIEHISYIDNKHYKKISNKNVQDIMENEK